MKQSQKLVTSFGIEARIPNSLIKKKNSWLKESREYNKKYNYWVAIKELFGLSKEPKIPKEYVDYLRAADELAVERYEKGNINKIRISTIYKKLGKK